MGEEGFAFEDEGHDAANVRAGSLGFEDDAQSVEPISGGSSINPTSQKGL